MLVQSCLHIGTEAEVVDLREQGNQNTIAGIFEVPMDRHKGLNLRYMQTKFHGGHRLLVSTVRV